MNCPVCGADNDNGASFCYRCGSSLKPTTAAVGPTVNLGRGATPPFGSEAVSPSPSEEHGARVYDVPENTATSRPTTYAEPPSAPNTGAYTPSTPQYVIPRQDQQGPPYQQPGMVMVQQSNTALVALILGLVSFFGLSLLTAIPAVIIGRNARKEIQESRGLITGEGMAQAGIILGWINIGLSVLAMCLICGIPFLGILGASVGG